MHKKHRGLIPSLRLAVSNFVSHPADRNAFRNALRFLAKSVVFH